MGGGRLGSQGGVQMSPRRELRSASAPEADGGEGEYSKRRGQHKDTMEARSGLLHVSVYM